MEALASASSVIAVGSLAIQLAETIQKLVEFWKAVQNAPAEINSLFSELKCLSKVLEKVAELNLGEDLASCAAYALWNCQSKIAELRKEAHTAAANLSSQSSYKRKWSAVRVTLKKAQIDSLRNALENAKSTILIFQSISIQSDLRSLREITLRTLESVESTSFSSHRGNMKIDHVKIGSGKPTRGLYIKDGSRQTSQDLFPVEEANPMHGLSECLPAQSSELHIAKKKYEALHFSSLALPAPLWAIQSELRTRKVMTNHGSYTQELVETDSSYVLYPSNFLRKLGLSYGIWVQSKSITGWHFSLQPFIAVPSDSAIFQFCCDGNVSAIKVLLSLGQASVRDRDPLGRTPLWIAAQSLQLEAAELLLQQGADPHTCDWWDRCPPLTSMRLSKEVDVQKKLSMFDLLERWSSDSYEEGHICHLIGLNLMAYRPERSWELMPLSLPDRKNSALQIVKRLLPLFPADDMVWSQAIHAVLQFRYDQEVLHWSLRNMKGMLHDAADFTTIQLSIAVGLPLRDLMAMRMIVEKATNVQLHQFKNYKDDSPAPASTPTLLVLYQPAMFLAWRNLLLDVGLDVEEFVREEMEQPMVKEQGWTEQSLMALFKYEFQSPASVPRPGVPHCERCGHLYERRIVDLGWRRRIREFRCGRVSSAKDCTGDNNSIQSEGVSHDAEPYNIVCSEECEDGVCVAWIYEDDGDDDPYRPPFDRDWKEKEQPRIEEMENGDDFPTRNMPGSFVG